MKVRKLDPRAREALFLGYAESSKAYKLCDGELQKIVISRDEVFDAFSSGVCGNIGEANTFDTDEDLVSLDIENDNHPSKVASPNETLKAESGEVAIPSLQIRSCMRVQTVPVLTLRYHRLRLMIPQGQVSFPVVKFIHRCSPDLNRVDLPEFGIQCQNGGEQCIRQVSRQMHTLQRTSQTPTNRQ